MKLRCDHIEATQATQVRTELSKDVIDDYCQAIKDGAIFPAIILYFDGAEYWPGDGFHRIEAARRIGNETILAEIKEGG